MNIPKQDTHSNSPLKFARLMIGLGVTFIILTPILFTRSYLIQSLDFTETGQIGDTIGGITAPFLSLIGAILVFYALQAQVKANELVQSQIERDGKEKDLETEGHNLNQLYSYLNESINNFRFKSLPTYSLRNPTDIETEVAYVGGEAFYHLFSQIRCHYHGTQEELHGHQSVSELLSILKVMHLLLIKLENSHSKNVEILRTLIKHLFEYKLITRVRDDSIESLQPYYCNSCQCDHGLPNELRNLIDQIRQKLEIKI